MDTFEFTFNSKLLSEASPIDSITNDYLLLLHLSNHFIEKGEKEAITSILNNILNEDYK